MSAPTAALLVDLENFFRGRESNYKRDNADDEYDVATDLKLLVEESRQRAGRLIVLRAYADFETGRRDARTKQWTRYLRGVVDHLMENGIEPVQVFRFKTSSGRLSNKNAADMRMAMDAGGLMFRTPIEKFILVTGDSDFVPVAVELRRRGAIVDVIGIEGITHSAIRKYCDRFDYFEELVARQEEEASGGLLERISNVLQEHIGQSRKSKMNCSAVRPLLNDKLNTPFSPEDFGCRRMRDFMRKYAEELGVVIREGNGDYEVHLPISAPGIATETEQLKHTASDYHKLLKLRAPYVRLRPQQEWSDLVSLVIEAFQEAAGALTQKRLSADLSTSDVAGNIADSGQAVRDVLGELWHASVFARADGLSLADHIDWDAEVKMLSRELSDIQTKSHRFVVELLRKRLSESESGEHIEAEPLADLLFEGDLPRATQLLNKDE